MGEPERAGLSGSARRGYPSWRVRVQRIVATIVGFARWTVAVVVRSVRAMCGGHVWGPCVGMVGAALRVRRIQSHVRISHKQQFRPN